MKLTIHSKYTLLFLLFVLLLVLNIVVITNSSLEISRMVRVLSTFAIFCFFIYYKKYWQGFVFLALVLFTVRDIFIINYEISNYKTASFIFTILAYLVLAYFALKKFKFKKSTPIILSYMVAMVGLNIFNLYYLSDPLTDKLDNETQLALFYVQGGVLLLLGFAAYMYYDRFFGKTPLHYLFFVICFIFSDLCGLAAYFYEIEAAFYLERSFYILALYLLVNFVFTLASAKGEGELDLKRESYL
ncbi:MAG: hypothetical protein WD554_04380 [Flavobacteriaceae bacterium]